jgi:hypothetical protein
MNISHGSVLIRIMATSVEDNCTSYKWLLKALKAKSVTQKKKPKKKNKPRNQIIDAGYSSLAQNTPGICIQGGNDKFHSENQPT